MSVTEQSAAALEWRRMIRLAEPLAGSEPGRGLIREWLDASHWAEAPAEARLRQQETREAADLLEKEGLWSPLRELADPASALATLDRNGVLDLAELVLMRDWLVAIDSWVHGPREEAGIQVKRSVAALLDPMQPLRDIDRVLTETGELSETASPKLASLYGQVRALKREIDAVMARLLKRYSEDGLLQESFSDVRDGRYVLPVRISEQSRVGGIVAGISASSQTAYVEPPEVSALNNRLREAESELQREIYTVLARVSGGLAEFTEEIRESVGILAHWDAVAARARLAHLYGGVPIDVPDDRALLLRDTAHPLLWWSVDDPEKEIIRNTIDLEDANLLLITGPNTGGKTVLLKTIGLAAICARTGFFYPGTGRGRVPFFDSLFVDVGDPQSIEEHLSSFSGHILRFRQVLEEVSPLSLVLIDELNTATDPEEGAALCRAFLEAVLETADSAGAAPLLVATTHDPQLKALAATDSRIRNASMEFDDETYEPTYRLLADVPGLSRALETAERLGLPGPVLERARSYLSKEHHEFERLLGALRANAARTEEARREAERLEREARRLRDEWHEKTSREAEALMERTREKLRRMTVQAQEEIRSAVKRLGNIQPGAGMREAERIRGQVTDAFESATRGAENALREEAPEIQEHLARKRDEAPETVRQRELAAGTAVRIPKFRAYGEVVDVQGKRLKVAMTSPGKPLGSGMTVSLKASEVEPVTEQDLRNAGVQVPKKATASVSYESSADSISAQIDVRGERFEAGIRRIEHYLDEAYRSGLAEVTVIHGIGTGALREGTRQLLKGVPYVIAFRDGGEGRGGPGATVVEFTRK